MISISPAYTKNMHISKSLLITLSHIRLGEATESETIIQLYRFSICQRYAQKQTYTPRTRAKTDISEFEAAAERIVSIC